MPGGVVLLDFDGTLAHRPGMWSQCLLDVLEQMAPGHGVSLAQLRPLLHDGFPWHSHQRPHPELSDPDAWWGQVGALFADAFRSVGLEDSLVADAVLAVRTHYCDARRFHVFEDTIPALRELKNAGWRTVVVSNHVPELSAIVNGVGLSPWIDDVFSSALTGYEKPHPEAFQIGLAGVAPSQAWMIGDSPAADVHGAEAVGVRAILVRNQADGVRHQRADLFGAAMMILTRPEAPHREDS